MHIRDNIHYNFRKIDSYNKPINITISSREASKSTSVILDKSYLPFKKKGCTTLYLVRNIVEINEAMILSIQDNIINKFTDDNVAFEFNKGAFRDGIVDIKIGGKLYMRILALSIPLRRIKQALLKDIGVIIFDEFIINPRKAEKYLKGEAFAISEIYTTYKRERFDSTPLKMYFLGNPYSLYNPIFLWLGVSPSKLRKGECLVGENYVVEWYKLLPELREKILAENPLYEFDEDYKEYALEGNPINDDNIKIGKLPIHYNLRFVFKVENKFIGIFQNNYWEDREDLYFCKFMTPNEISNRRVAYCFEFADLISGCSLFSNEDKNRFNRFKIAMRKRLVAFQSIDCYYLIEEIYYNL